MFDVMVVPTFSPKTSITPCSMCRTPVEQSIIVMAMMAAELWTHRVSTVPMSRKRSETRKPPLRNSEKKAVMASFDSGLSTSEKPVSFSVAKPKKRNATPKRKSPTMRRFFMYISMMPRKKAG